METLERLQSVRSARIRSLSKAFEDLNRAQSAALAIAMLLPVFVVVLSPLYSIDDGFISFRYGYNLAHGFGLVYNPGQHVEGYTNLLWTLVAALVIWAGFAVMPLMSWVGITFAWLSLLTLWGLCRFLRLGFVPSLLAVLALALYQNFWTIAADGLEEGLAGFLLMQSVYWLCRERYSIAGIAGALLFATRPDSLAVVPLATAWMLFSTRGSPGLKERARLSLRLALPWLAIVLGVTLWRLAYYHAMFPNTITAKAAPLDLVYFVRNIVAGIIYWFGFLVAAFPLSLGLLGLPFMRRRGIAMLCGAILGAQLVVILVAGGDWMPGYRLLTMYAQLLALMLALALSSLAARISRRTLLAGGAAAVAVWSLVLAHDPWHSPSAQIMSSEPCWQNMANRLTSYVRPSDVLAPEATGVLGYELSGTRIYDFQGLTDAYSAHHGTIYTPTYGKFAPAYALRQVKPTLFIFQSGRKFLSPLAAVPNGVYGRAYASFSVSSYPQCTGKRIVIGVQKAEGTHLLAAFRGLRVTQIRPRASS